MSSPKKIQVPTWVKNAIFYQIFPDRFAKSEALKHPPGISFKPWRTPPAEQGFQGGDLLGIVEKLDYLQALGINALYLNPIFASASNHRYHTFDYLQVDPLLGGNEALRTLLDAAHARDIKVVLDGVFNHASRGFWAFHHILETGANSPYLDWFLVDDWPLNPYPRSAEADEEPLNYQAWWDLPALPKFNTDNPGVRDYIMHVAEYWLNFGIDGWRLDVPSEIDDDSFWQEFRRVVKAANPEAYIVGEIWHPAQRWLQGDQFDAVMNYVFSRAAMGFFGAKTLRLPDEPPGGESVQPLDGAGFAEAVEVMHNLYDWEINHVQLNLLDSHDTPRALWWLGEDESALRLCVLFQMTMPGAPCIYYGSEIGLSAANDPHCREAFPWDERDTWNADLLDFYQRAARLRHAHPVLRTGTFTELHASPSAYAFARQLGDTVAVIAFNASELPITLSVPLKNLAVDGTTFAPAWGSHDSLVVEDGHLAHLTVSARAGVVLVAG